MIRRLASFVLALLIASQASADTLTIPNSFTNGTVADATEVNANFTAVANETDKITDGFYFVQDDGALSQVDIEAAIQAACTADGNQLEDCREIVLPAGTFTLTDTVYFTNDGNAPVDGTTLERIWGLKMRGAGGTYLGGSSNVAAGTECATTIVWSGSSSLPMFHLHGLRRVTISDMCFVMDGGQDGTNPASDAILVTATNADGEVSQGVRLSNIDIWGHSGNWTTNNTYDSTCIRLAPSDYSGDPPYATDAQIDNFIVENSRLSCDTVFVGANGNTNGVFFLNTVFEYTINGLVVEDTDVHVVGGYTSLPLGYGASGAEATACAASDSFLLIGSTSDQQPKNVNLVGHNAEGNCGQFLKTVNATTAADQRDSAFSMTGSSVTWGAASVDHVFEYTHFGSFSVLGSFIGIRNGEDYTTTGRAFFAIEPDTRTAKTLSLILDASNLDDWNSGVFRVVTNSQVDLLDSNDIDLGDTYTWTGTHDFTSATATAATASVNDNDTSVATTAFVQAETVAAGDVTGTIGGGLTVGANSVALSTDTTGNYVATIADSGASEVTVSGSGSEGAAVTLALAASITRDSELFAYTVSTADPVDGSDACDNGDMWLNRSGNTIFFCVDGSTDDWWGVNLSDAP